MNRNLKRSFQKIEKSYNRYLKQNLIPKSGSTAEWLLDNYYIFAQEYASYKNMRLKRKDQIRAFESIYTWTKNMLSENEYRFEEAHLYTSLQKAQEKNYFTQNEISLLPSAVLVNLFEKAATLLKENDKSISFSNIIRSMLSLRELDMEDVFEKHCHLDIMLNRDETYSKMTSESKRLYKNAVSLLSSNSKKTEEEVISSAFSLAQNKDKAEKEVGYYLIGEGQEVLRNKLGLRTYKIKNKTNFYLLSVFLLSFFIIFGVFFLSENLLLTVLSLLPGTEIALKTLQYIFLQTTGPKQLPRMAFENGIPEKVIIVYPTLLSSIKKAEEMADKLEVCYLANKDDNLKFTILGDFKDSGTAFEDSVIINALHKKIDNLNVKYGNRFYALCRKQIYAPKQKKWMGRERKRGALHDFNEFLRGNYEFRYAQGKTEELVGTNYVLTLDDDTLLPPSSAKKLIGTALHPLHRPKIKDGRVVSGYGIMQPRVSIRLESTNKTFFSRIIAGQGGIDTYQSPSSEFYMDIFSESIFTGKGIYHVDSFRSCTSFPDDTVLSHDLLEGCYLRSAYVSDVQVFDACPSKFSDYYFRLHRWIRGDWQINRWLCNKVKNNKNEVVKNPISTLSKWKIFDNMRRSLTPFFQLLLLSSGNVVLSIFSLISLGLPLLFSAFDFILRKSFYYLREKRTANIFSGVRSAVYQTTLSVVFLAYASYISLTAALQGFIRSFTHQKTLEWITASDAEKIKKKTFSSTFFCMLPSVLWGVMLIFLSLFGIYSMGGLPLFFGCIWMVAPCLAYVSCIETEEDEISISPKSKEFLQETAGRIWQYFSDYMTEEDNFLPPDNVQVKPYKGAAHRTSPTNIGLAMISALCAFDLGFISGEEMEEKIEKTLETVEALPKWNGHLYNWYNTKTLKPMLPRYISTVDSGNFVSYLITVAMGIKEYRGKETPLCKRLLTLAENTDFGPLYYKKKAVFSIGFSLDENKLTDSYYDLLASEARQAGFIAIALGQIPIKHWFSLGRGLVESEGYKGLASWSGTMFEYFMPLLIMRKYENSLLSETYRFALLCQKKYGKKRRVPWGVSESGFYAFDNEDNYQYKAFGIPKLSLARQNTDDIVIAPYATILALPEDPKSAIYNMHLLKKEGLFGEYGFFEAADFTPSRLHGNMRRGIVKSYMSHHQGMSLAAITNLLCKNALQRRFHMYPPVKATEPLLKEKVPVFAAVLKEKQVRISPVRFKLQENRRCLRVLRKDNLFPNPVQLLTNGSYHVHIDTHGKGKSMLSGIDLNSFSPHFGGGQSIWILNTVTGDILDAYGDKIIFSENKAEFINETPALSTKLSVMVSPDDTCETRRLSLVNQSGKTRTYEIYYFSPLSLTTASAERAHPAFSKLFVKTDNENDILYARRRKRNENDKCFVAFAALYPEGKTEGKIQFDTDRLSFFGRTDRLPVSLSQGSILGGKTGAVLDPCFAYKIRMTVDAGKSCAVTFVTGLAESKEKAALMAEKFKACQMSPAKYAPDILLKENEEALFLKAASYIIYSGCKQKEIEEARLRNKLPKRELWKFGISGDNPIISVRLTEIKDEALLSEAIKAQLYWKSHGLKTDLVVFCDEPMGYTRPVFEMAEKMKNGSMYILGRNDINEKDFSLILAASTIYLCGDKGFGALPPYETAENAKTPNKTETDMPLSSLPLLYHNGKGGFDSERGEYVINIKKAGETPMPWSHVIANEKFGFVVTESGGGYTFSENSYHFRISPWSNDPVRDPLSEFLTLEENEDIWSPVAGTFREEGNYRVRYGMGYAIFERNTRGFQHKVTMFVPKDRAQKIISVSLINTTDSERKLKVKYSFYPVLGTNPSFDSICVIKDGAAVTLSNPLTDEKKKVTLCGTKCRCGYHDKKAFAVSDIVLKPNEEKSVVFSLGTDEEIPMQIENALAEVKEYWKDICGNLQAHTDDVATNLMLGSWLLYQTLSCRIFARTAFYQSGGAFGFRDQLQDSLAFIDCAPHITRKQILLHARYQFEEGDVFHWWHTDETGVRTRFSDDRLFLPYVALIYAEETGDNSIWEDKEPFVIEPPLRDDEEERYTFVKGRTEPYTIYEHCIRAIEISLQKGAHGLPLMGGGDWNDGMNKIGIGGKGESIWLAWFLKNILDKFALLAESRGDSITAERYKKESLLLLESLESEAWADTHYARAFYDCGKPLGTSASAECSIDAISQAWSVIAGGGKITRQKSAMQSVYSVLADRNKGIIHLLAPPFENTAPSPGYIQSYPKGIRENGGQYTHGAIWAVMAFAILGDKEKAWELIKMLNPISHTKTANEINIYKTEPYVMTADIYTAEGHEGRGGWSWYTGAAAWMYRVGVRYILGFKRRGDTVWFEPMMPLGENGFTLKYHYKTATYIFKVHGKSDKITLSDDGKVHEITIKGM